MHAGYCNLDSTVSFIVPIETAVQIPTDVSCCSTLGAMGKSSGSKKEKAICTNAISNTTQRTDRNLNIQHKQCKSTHRLAKKSVSSTRSWPSSSRTISKMEMIPKTRARHPNQTQTPTTNKNCNTPLAFKHYLLQAKKKRSPSSSSSSSSSSSGVRKFSRHVSMCAFCIVV